MVETDEEGIVVLGFPRSGTTLLRRLLDAHSEISCPPETNLLSACARFLAEEPVAEGLSVGVVPGLAYSDISEDAVLARLRAMVFDFHRSIAEKAGKTLWVEKTAFDVFHLDEIERLLGDRCRYLCVFRHPLDVVPSVLELTNGMDRHLPELHPYIAHHPAPSEAVAHALLDCHARLRRFMADHADRCKAVHYETLLSQPESTLSEVFDFIGAPATPQQVLESAFADGAQVGLGDWKTYDTKGLSTASTERWRQLPPSTIAGLVDLLSPVIEDLGYPPVERPDVPAGNSARRRYRAAKFVRQMQARGRTEG
jgi:hypothetical protein